MARELGGRRGAQLVAAAAAVPFCIVSGALMQYVAFDYLCWVLAAYFIIRLLKSGDPRWWLAIGAAIGLGMMSKYTMGFFALGITAGVLATNARRHLASKWLWMGVALSLLVFLPNFLWQAQHHFISLDFLHTIHQRDVRIGRAKGFFPDQLKFTLLGFPLWLAGLYFYLFSKPGRRFRMLGWMYIVPLLLFVVAKGRGYYLGPAYPMLYAAGAVWGEQRLQSLSRVPAATIRTLAWIALTADVLLVGAIAIPPAPVNSPLWTFAAKNNGDLLEELGWPELVQAIAQIRDSLPAARSLSPRHPRRQLWRSRRRQSLRSRPRLPRRHQRRQFVLGPRLRQPSAANANRPRILRVFSPAANFASCHVAASHSQPLPHRERRNPRPSRPLPLPRPSAKPGPTSGKISSTMASSRSIRRVLPRSIKLSRRLKDFADLLISVEQ